MKQFIMAIALVGAFSTVLMHSEAAQARGIAIINTGEDLFEAGPLPEPYNEDPEAADYQAGFKCSVFGVFWVYLHWWDCQPVAIADDSYNDDPEVAKAIGEKYKQGDMKVGFWKGYMRWVLLALILGFVAFFFFARGKDDNEKTETESESDHKPQE